ncbi:hypothetical protein L9F63_015371, partial [Diploptera punctata]
MIGLCLCKDIISSRKRRFLAYPPGTTVELIVGFGLPTVMQEQSLTLGTVLKFTYSVPRNATVYSDAIFGKERRSVSRWELYSRLEAGCN